MLTPSTQYQTAREALRQAEIELKEQREAVAALRRDLPPGPVLQDYAFGYGNDDSAAGDDAEPQVRLSALFRQGCSSLAVIHFMYKPEDQAPCPMCTMWADGYNAVMSHLDQHLPVVMVAKAPVARLRAHGRNRG